MCRCNARVQQTISSIVFDDAEADRAASLTPVSSARPPPSRRLFGNCERRKTRNDKVKATRAGRVSER